MTLLDFARGPGLQGAWLVMGGGTAWRIAGILLLRQRLHLAAPRIGFAGRVRGGLATVFTRFVPRRTFWPRIAVSVGLSSTFHLGLAVIVLGGAPHILLIHQFFWLTWPNLPKGLVVIVSGVTLASMIALLFRRIYHPVLRLLSTADDYLSWVLVFLPVLTGILLSGETIASYSTWLTMHILSVELMMVWLPFGKLLHVKLAFFSRAAMGMNFARKGAAT
jgi:nitrate reductase gamma subunit